MDLLNALVVRAKTGDLEAFGRIVAATETMAFAVAVGVLRDAALAQDAVQDAYVIAFRRLADLDEPAAFLSWFRRIVITTAINARRARRRTFLQLDAVTEVPVLDEAETRWSDAQRQRLAQAMVTLTNEERRLCDRRYHGGWSTARLAADAGVDEAAMRKRLQRVRDKLRKEIEMSERKAIDMNDVPRDLPARIVELLARPQLTELPENPVGKVLEMLRAVYAGFDNRDLPEMVDFDEAERGIGRDALYIDPIELHRAGDGRILRYDLTLPLLLNVRYESRPLRIFTSGKAYRACKPDPMHLEAFHQAEVFCLDEKARLDMYQILGLVLRSVHEILPGRAVQILPTQYTMCSQAWDVNVDDNGRWLELAACGVFTDRIVAHMGGDPAVHTAVGAGYGLERFAMLRYGIDDIRRMDVSNVA
jgi:RNA polymerase sigma factor (sigma-70 family)